MRMDELKFKINIVIQKFKIILTYFLKEPVYEIKKLLSGAYRSILLFYLTIFTAIYIWKQNIGGYKIKLAVILIILSYFYAFYKSGKWKELYKQDFTGSKKNE